MTAGILKSETPDDARRDDARAVTTAVTNGED
jgi:hypothetical protein